MDRNTQFITWRRFSLSLGYDLSVIPSDALWGRTEWRCGKGKRQEEGWRHGEAKAEQQDGETERVVRKWERKQEEIKTENE